MIAGSLEDQTLRELVRSSSNDFMKLWLFTEGPEQILAWAGKKNPLVDWENRYAHNCDACRQVFSDPKVMDAISAHYREKVENVTAKYVLFQNI